jgi:hypothetical protein
MRKSGTFSRTQPPFACDELIVTVRRSPHEKGLNDSLGADRGYELGEMMLVEFRSRLSRIGSNPVDRNREVS